MRSLHVGPLPLEGEMGVNPFLRRARLCRPLQAHEPALLRPTGGVPLCRWGRGHNIPKVLPRCQCGPLLVVAHDHAATATTAAATHCIHDTIATYCYDMFRKVDAVEERAHACTDLVATRAQQRPPPKSSKRAPQILSALWCLLRLRTFFFFHEMGNVCACTCVCMCMSVKT